MKVYSLALASLSFAVLTAGCKPAELDSGFVSAHEDVAAAACCRANAYAAAAGAGVTVDVAELMNTNADACYASFGSREGVVGHTEKALPSGYDSEYDYTSKLSEADRAKIEAIQERAQACTARANQTWDANLGL